MSERETDGKVGGELLSELFSALEDLETQSAGILQFLKDKGLASDEELAPYLEAAARASDVRWRAARLRMDVLLSAAIEDAEEEFARKIEERKEEPRKLEKGRQETKLFAKEDQPKSKADDENAGKALQSSGSGKGKSAQFVGGNATERGGEEVEERRVEAGGEETASRLQPSGNAPEKQQTVTEGTNDKAA